MLSSPEIVEVLLQNLSDFPVRALVVDLVMVSTSGHVLAGSSILSIFKDRLLAIADIITPNVKEASALLGGVRIEGMEACNNNKTLFFFHHLSLQLCLLQQLCFLNLCNSVCSSSPKNNNIKK